MNKRPILIAGLLLGLFAVAGTSLVAITHHQTRDKILENERLALLDKLHAVVPETEVDNDMAADVLAVSDPELLGMPETTVYRGRKDGQPVAVVIASVVPDGYSGPLKLLVGVRPDGRLSGVRVVSHKETPGLGDKIEEDRSDWIFGFVGKSLGDPPEDKWKVKRDGGVFDQFTGATITPRSVVGAVKKTLLFVKKKGLTLYQDPDKTAASAQTTATAGG